MKKENLFILIIFALFMGGCYTQFTTLQDRYYEPPRHIQAPCDSCEAPADSAGTLAEGKDTVYVKEREACYWEQNFFGEWQLRCYNTNYPDYHHRYYNRPWWYTGNYNSLNDPYECHCPYHVFYHPSCESCWYYCDRYSHMWNNNNNNNINDTTGHIPSGSTSQGPTIPVKKGSGRGDGAPNPGNTAVGPKPQKTIPAYIPTVPVKKPESGQGSTGNKPNDNISNSGKVPVNSGSNTDKPVPKEPKKRRYGRGR